jgi:hypothetical protein
MLLSRYKEIVDVLNMVKIIKSIKISVIIHHDFMLNNFDMDNELSNRFGF